MNPAMLLVPFITLLAADKADELAKFDGTWTPTRYTVDGKEVPADMLKKIKLTVKGGESTFDWDGKVGKGNYNLDPTKKPKEIDIVITSGEKKGTTHLGIYEFDGDTLRICFTDTKTRPKKFESSAEAKTTLEVWKKK